MLNMILELFLKQSGQAIVSGVFFLFDVVVGTSQRFLGIASLGLFGLLRSLDAFFFNLTFFLKILGATRLKFCAFLLIENDPFKQVARFVFVWKDRLRPPFPLLDIKDVCSLIAMAAVGRAWCLFVCLFRCYAPTACNCSLISPGQEPFAVLPMLFVSCFCCLGVYASSTCL